LESLRPPIRFFLFDQTIKVFHVEQDALAQTPDGWELPTPLKLAKLPDGTAEIFRSLLEIQQTGRDCLRASHEAPPLRRAYLWLLS
jgi:hypothetical protein